MRKRILFIIRSTEHLSYYQSIINSLLKRGCFVKVLFNKNWSTDQKFEQRSKNVEFGWSLIRQGALRPLIFLTREIRSYRRYLLVKGQSDYYKKRWQGYLPFIIQLLTKLNLVNDFIKTKLFGFILEQIEMLTPSDKSILKNVLEFNSSVVIAGPANMRFSEEIEYIKAAKALNIPTFIPVISWDNLTTKGLIQIKPDKLLVWNEEQKKEAIRHHKIPNKNITITGSPFFDKWFDIKKPKLTKVMFCKKYNLNPDLPIILYLGSSSNIASNETWLIHKIKETLKDTQIIFRPHPANFRPYRLLNLTNVTVLPKNSSLPDSENELGLFYMCLKYSYATIGINTSGMIDAIIAGRPCISIITEKYNQTQSEAEHFKQLLKNKALYLAYSMYDLKKVLIKLKSGSDDLLPNRIEFIKKYIRPYGLKQGAGEKAAEEIVKLV